jgi:phosphoglycolate phosphatase-like HAD superfamily hydrolase
MFWDLDGPILDIRWKYYGVYADLVRARGASPLGLEDYWSRKREREPDEVILAQSGLGQHTRAFQELRRSRIETDHYLAMDSVWPGLHDLLSGLGRSWQMVLVTLRHDREALMHQLERLHLRSRFDAIVSSPGEGGGGERGDRKAQAVREILGPVRYHGWFVGDTETDIVAGQRLGVCTAAVTFGIRTPSHLARLDPDVMLDSPGALVAWCSGLDATRSEPGHMRGLRGRARAPGRNSSAP